jgi:hypothetical protein
MDTKYILIFLFLILDLGSLKPEDENEEGLTEIECDPNLPHFSVGDYNLTRSNYTE